MTPWPQSVWNAAVLRGVDARGRAEIQAAGALRVLAPGEVVFRAGEPADSFFVVAEGLLQVRAVRRGDVALHVLRQARTGDAFGEEGALRAGGTRQTEAASEAKSRVAEIPLNVFRRAINRDAGVENAIAARLERTLRRAATRDLLRTMSFTRELNDPEIEVFLDAVEHTHLGRGEVLFREGEAASHVYFVADGMLQVQTEDEERIRVRAYLGRGDVVGDVEAEMHVPRRVSVVASGAAWVLGVPREVVMGIARRRPELLDSIRRVQDEADDQMSAQHGAIAHANTTQHVFKDLYRMQVARSLLVIDENSCVRCGHCSWSCASAHVDGISRLVRRGEKVVTRIDRGEHADAAPLLIPNSCQHCENPACMPDCPTGAIGRDPRGEVFIRESLCTGCGNCAKGCPWDNIQMAPRGGKPGFVELIAKPRPKPKEGAAPAAHGPGTSPDVAVKCDLCEGVSGGPACVSACPTSAIVRINPSEVLPDVRAALEGSGAGKRAASAAKSIMPSPAPAWPWVLGAAPIAIAIAQFRATGARALMVSGLIAGLLVLALVAYAGIKRFPARRLRTRSAEEKARATASTRRLRPWFVAHLAVGAVTIGALHAHAGVRVPSNAAGALAIALWTAVLTGVFGAFVYRVLPPRLSRLERGGALPEDLGPRARSLDERAFRALSGRSELVKTIYARILRPYARNVLGPLILFVRGKSLGEEQRRLRARIDAVLTQGGSAGQDRSEKLQGLDELIRLIVERRAIPAQVWLQRVLRGWLPLHIASTATAIVLLALHAFFALTSR